MRSVTIFCLALTAAITMGALAATVSFAESTPLPDLHTALPGEVYPLLLGGHLSTKIKLENAEGFQFKANEVSVLLTASELTSLGTATLELSGVSEANEESLKCNSLGASESRGEVIYPNAEWHLVYTALSPGENLELGGLMLFSKFVISCDGGIFELMLTGPWLARLNVPTPEAGAEGDSAGIEIAASCREAARQELPYYYDDTLTRVATTLLSTAGDGNRPACELIGGTVLVTPETGSVTTMFSVLF